VTPSTSAIGTTYGVIGAQISRQLQRQRKPQRRFPCTWRLARLFVDRKALRCPTGIARTISGGGLTLGMPLGGYRPPRFRGGRDLRRMASWHKGIRNLSEARRERAWLDRIVFDD
jgi:hypothetical protein